MTQVFGVLNLLIWARKKLTKAWKIGAKKKGSQRLLIFILLNLDVSGHSERENKDLVRIGKHVTGKPGEGTVGRVRGKGEPGTPTQGQGPSTLIATMNRFKNITRSSKRNFLRKDCFLGPTVKN